MPPGVQLRPRYGLVGEVPPVRSGKSPRYGKSQEVHHLSADAGLRDLMMRETTVPDLAASTTQRSAWSQARRAAGLMTAATNVNWSAALKPALAVHRATEQARIMQEIKESGMVVIEQQRDARAVEYWQQGDESLQTVEVMKQRVALRHEPRVIAALLAWCVGVDGSHIAHTMPSARTLSAVSPRTVSLYTLLPHPSRLWLRGAHTGGRPPCAARASRTRRGALS